MFIPFYCLIESALLWNELVSTLKLNYLHAFIQEMITEFNIFKQEANKWDHYTLSGVKIMLFSSITEQ